MWYGDERYLGWRYAYNNCIPQLTWGKIIQTPILIKFIYLFIYLFDLIFNNRFIVSGKQYPGWRYAYNPCTPVDVGQNDPDADPHKLCRDVAVSFSRDLQILCPKKQCSFLPISNFVIAFTFFWCELSFFSFSSLSRSRFAFLALLLLLPFASVLLPTLPLLPIFITFVKISVAVGSHHSCICCCRCKSVQRIRKILFPR